MKKVKNFFKGQFIGFLSFLAVWGIIHLALKNRTIPAPIETIIYMVKNIRPILSHLGGSVLRIIVSIGISLIIAIPFGIILGINEKAKKIFLPLLYFIYPIPKIAFLPVFMILFGLGNISKVLLIIFIIVFQIIISIKDGVDKIEKVNFKVIESFCTSRKDKYKFLIIPAIIPSIFSGLRISIGISLASLFFAENYATKYGIGYYILSGWTKMNYTEMFAGILALGILGVLLFKILDKIEDRFIPWN